MSIFTKPPNDRMPSRTESAPSEPNASIIAQGMRIIGDIETTGIVKIEGTVEGSVRGARQLLLGRSGIIQGDVSAQEAVLGGRVVGTVMASERVEIQSTSRVDGDVQTKSIVVFEGGLLNGHVRMNEAGEPGQANAASPNSRFERGN